MAKVFDSALAAELKLRGVWPLRDFEVDVPDEWLALLDHLHGQSAPDNGCDLPQGDGL